MGYLPDTAFLIDLVRSDPGAVAKAERIQASGAATHLAAPVLYELLVGLLWRRSRTETNRFRRIVSRFPLLAFDEHAARAAAELQAELYRLGRPASHLDVMIAGIARHHGHVVVTRDERFLDPDIGEELGLDAEGY